MKRALYTGIEALNTGFIIFLGLAIVATSAALLISGAVVAWSRPAFWLPVVLAVAATPPHFAVLKAVKDQNRLKIDEMRSGARSGRLRIQRHTPTSRQARADRPTSPVKRKAQIGLWLAVAAGVSALLIGTAFVRSSDNDVLAGVAIAWGVLALFAEVFWVSEVSGPGDH